MQLAQRLQQHSAHVLCARKPVAPRQAAICHQRLRLPRASTAEAAVASVPFTNGNGHATSALAEPFTIKFPDPVPQLAAPAGVYQMNVKGGAYKASLPAWKTFLLALQAGAFIALAGFLAVTVGGSMPGLTSTNPGLVKLITAMVFPVGILMVLVCGAELYTGNTALLTIAVYEKKATMTDLIRNWIVSWTGNLVGSLIMVAAIAGTGMLATNTVCIPTAIYKTSLPLGQVVLRAILCNWLVCVGVWQANAATTLPGKVLAVWAPISTFVAIGLEHSVANMFFIPMGMALGAKITFAEFMTSNLIPVTIGNTIGGAIFMGTTYALAYGALGQKIDKALGYSA